ncbi:DUF433 domain-containing protein [Mucilaginibacter sp. R-33]|uniref:DUF433 domain-containing protein n=1 Tax=Mucilaginibacter sp. R-33 TaxID=3416711 RepID=UPI003CF8949F
MNEKLIVCNKNICFGMPILKGRRLTVYDIVTKIYYEDILNIALEDYGISIAEAKAATNYCMHLHCQQDESRGQFCNGCILGTIEDGHSFNKDDYNQISDKLTMSKDGQLLFLGSIEELDDEMFGKPGWAIASEIYRLLI